MQWGAGQRLNRQEIQKGIQLLAKRIPVWNLESGSIDQYYWFWGTRVCIAAGGEPWKKWNKAIQHALLPSQNRRGSGSRTGSWDPVGVWGPDGGRVYSTALLALTLRSYYVPRYGVK